MVNVAPRLGCLIGGPALFAGRISLASGAGAGVGVGRSTARVFPRLAMSTGPPPSQVRTISCSANNAGPPKLLKEITTEVSDDDFSYFFVYIFFPLFLATLLSFCSHDNEKERFVHSLG